jgi:PAS domain-containing protein
MLMLNSCDAVRYAIERHRIEALRRSEDAYRSLIDDVFDTSAVAVFYPGQKLHRCVVQRGHGVYFGLGRDQMLGKDMRELVNNHLNCIFDDPDDYFERLLAAYAQQDFTDHFECHVLPGPNRDERWLEHWSQLIRTGMYAQGRIEHYTDITDRKLLQIAQEEQPSRASSLRKPRRLDQHA